MFDLRSVLDFRKERVDMLLIARPILARELLRDLPVPDDASCSVRPSPSRRAGGNASASTSSLMTANSDLIELALLAGADAVLPK